MATDPSGRYTAIYRPYHLIGLELGVSVASAALRGEATGAPDGWRGDVAAAAKRALAAGETLDGEGGYCVYGRLVPARRAFAERLLPIGLAARIRLRRPVGADDQGRLPDRQAIVGAAVDIVVGRGRGRTCGGCQMGHRHGLLPLSDRGLRGRSDARTQVLTPG